MNFANKYLHLLQARKTQHTAFKDEILPNTSYFFDDEFVLYSENDFNVSEVNIAKLLEADGFNLKENQKSFGWWNWYGFKFTKPLDFVVDIAERVSKLFKETLPDLFSKHLEIKNKYDSKYFLGDSIFTSVVLNKNYDVGNHFDANTYPDTLEAMVTIKSGPKGGYLNFNGFKHTLKNEHGNIVIFDGVNNMHSVTKIPEGQERYTLLFLINENIK